MLDRENEFFDDMKSDNLEETNTSSTGINYGNRNEKAGIKNIVIAIGAGAVFAAILVLLLSPKKNQDTNNFAEIPTLSQPTGPIKIEPTNQMQNTPDVFETATIYDMPTKKDFESFNPQQEMPTPVVVKSVEPAPVPTKAVNKLPTKQPIKADTKKPASTSKTETKVAPKPVAKTTPAPAPVKKLIETKTNVPGEVEVSPAKIKAQTSTTTQNGIWNVQLVSTSSESAAQNEWINLSKKYPSILGNKSHTVNKTEINGKTYYRLRVSNLATSEEATQICNQLKTYKLSCFVTK
ncbi:hypothetical protein HDR59_00460 [bacterium]|nr:hypothetical protein [bacterium]